MHSEMSIGGRVIESHRVNVAHFSYSINEQGKAWVSGRIRYVDTRPFPSSTEEYNCLLIPEIRAANTQATTPSINLTEGR